jgi:hypothetical protein
MWAVILLHAILGRKENDMPAKLVVIGDSISQGFLSGSISETQLSYPAMLAKCIQVNDFKAPDFSGKGGIPVNLETLHRLLADRYGEKINFLEMPLVVKTIHSFLDQVEDYWERGEGSQPSKTGPLHHNLAVWGFDMTDCFTLTDALCRRVIPKAKDQFLPWQEITEFPMYRTARRTLNPSYDPRYEDLTQIGAAAKIAELEGGIENLIFFLGANNCLGTVTTLNIIWSQDGDLETPAHKRHCNLWVPEHFEKLLDRAAKEVQAIGAKNVFVGTVPHVTIPPVSRGVSPNLPKGQERDANGYYEYYTHFWIWDENFKAKPHKYPYLTRADAKKIDDTIDEYNHAIRKKANALDWHVVDTCDVLDQLAFRRQGGQITYQFPPDLIAALKKNPATKERVPETGKPILDTRYLRIKLSATDPQEKYQGGLVSLDGVHPTTIGYGITAHEFLKVMQAVGVQSNNLNWDAIVAADKLVTNPPINLQSLQDILGFLYSDKMLAQLIRSLSGFELV